MLKREKNKAFYTHEKKIIDEATGEILLATKETIVKAAPEPDFKKHVQSHVNTVFSILFFY